MILNFATWSVARDPEHAGHYRIEVRDAEDFPDLLGWATEGLIVLVLLVHEPYQTIGQAG